MTRTILTLCLTLLVIFLAACTEPGSTPTPAPVVVLPTATVTLTPTVLPKATLAPTLTPTPAKIGRWECDPSGGVACYVDLYRVAMLDAKDGWAAGLQGMLLHYKQYPNQAMPTWNYVKSLGTSTIEALDPLSPDEVWGIQGVSIFRYHQGRLQEVPLSYNSFTLRLFDLTMVNSAEGWAVGQDGTIMHYTETQG
jgi:hypothetical protein